MSTRLAPRTRTAPRCRRTLGERNTGGDPVRFRNRHRAQVGISAARTERRRTKKPPGRGLPGKGDGRVDRLSSLLFVIVFSPRESKPRQADRIPSKKSQSHRNPSRRAEPPKGDDHRRHHRRTKKKENRNRQGFVRIPVPSLSGMKTEPTHPTRRTNCFCEGAGSRLVGFQRRSETFSALPPPSSSEGAGSGTPRKRSTSRSRITSPAMHRSSVRTRADAMAGGGGGAAAAANHPNLTTRNSGQNKNDQDDDQASRAPAAPFAVLRILSRLFALR